MNDSIRSFFGNFIKYFLYIAVFAQIVSGTVYLVCNFTGYIVYPETEEMIDVAQSLVFDEYTGFLYPLFLRVCLFIQKVCGIGYFMPAYVVQIGVFAVSVLYVMRPFFGTKRKWFAWAFALTNPMCVQTMLMIAPFAFKVSFGLFILGALIRLWIQKERIGIGNGVVLGVMYLLAVFNQPDDLLIWGLPIGMVALVISFRKSYGFKVWKKLGVLLMAGILIFTAFFVTDTVIEKGSRGRAQKSVEFMMFQRILWPDFGEKYTFLPERIRLQITPAQAFELDKYAESFMLELGPKLEETYGVETSRDIYVEAIGTQLEYNKRNILKNVLGDFTGYILEPYSSIWHMSGKSGSAFGKIYGFMNFSSEKWVYEYWCIAFVSLFVLSFWTCIKAVKNRLYEKKSFIKPAVMLLGVLVFQALAYTFMNVQGVDYRYALVHVVFFSLVAVYDLFRERNAR